MDFLTFIRTRRTQLAISQADLADRLAQNGYSVSPAQVGHWETGRNQPRMEEKQFRQALAASLEMSIYELLTSLGYLPNNAQHSAQALLAADIIDKLHPADRALAIDLLTTLKRHRRK